MENFPSEELQKEFENNPLKILETIRNEEEESQNSDQEISEKAKGKENVINRKNLYKMNFISNLKNTNNINCKNSLVAWNPNYRISNSNNIIVNHLNIFLFNTSRNFISDNESYIYNDVNNINNNVNNINNNNILYNNNKIIIKNSQKICKDNINEFNNGQNSEDTEKAEFFNKSNVNKIIKNLKTYKGSLILQGFLQNINDENQLSNFFKNIMPYICQIMCLEYGNYFFQKLIKKLNLGQRLDIYQIIQPEFVVIATNKCGTHSIQSLMDEIETPHELVALNNLLSQNMFLLFTDDNAYHIMMKMILDFPEEKRNLLNLYLVNNIDKIVTNCNGSFCINKYILNNKNLSLRKIMVENLGKNIKELIFNKFSCIIMLLVLQTFGVEWGGFIFNEVQENFAALIENQISNTFVSKVLEYLYNNNIVILKILVWSLYKNIVLVNYLFKNKNHSKILNQLIEYSDEAQKQYLYLLIKKA